MTVNTSLTRRRADWRSIIGALFTPPASGRELDRARARATLVFSSGSAMLTVILLVFSPFLDPDSRSALVLTTIPTILLAASIYLLIRASRYRVAYSLLTLLLCVPFAVVMFNTGGNTSLALLGALPITYAGFTLGLGAGLTVDIYLMGVFGVIVYYQLNLPGTLPYVDLNTLLSNALVLPFDLLSLTILVMLLARAQERTLVRNEQIASQLRAAAQLSQATLSTLDLNLLLQRTIDYIRDQFGFYHAQIFLIDQEREYAVLAASTGEAGAALLARGHRLAVGSKSVIGRVTQTAQPVITEDTADDPVHRPNDLLPNTRAEMAIPLLIGSDVIGALDVQSTRPNVFNNDDVDSLRIVAAQVSSAIRNAQLFTQQATIAEQNQRLLAQSEGNLREIEQLNQRLTSAAWGEYVQAQQAGTLGVTIENGVLQRETRAPAHTSGNTITRKAETSTTSLPLIIGGRSIGTIEVELAANSRTEESMAIVRSVADRLVFSLENARLLEQTQALARQEALVNNISTRMQSAATINDLLRLTLAELSQALGAQQAVIQIASTKDVKHE